AQPKLNKYATLELVKQKLSLAEMAEKLNFKPNTILTHLEKLIDLGEQIDMQYLMPEKKIYQKIKQAFENVGLEKLKPVFEELKEEYSYDVLKLVRLNLKNLKG
ncbi:MAG: helix-turn-helix domain-containing protein, partial [Patescibacteria group bacterium]